MVLVIWNRDTDDWHPSSCWWAGGEKVPSTLQEDDAFWWSLLELDHCLYVDHFRAEWIQQSYWISHVETVFSSTGGGKEIPKPKELGLLVLTNYLYICSGKNCHFFVCFYLASGPLLCVYFCSFTKSLWRLAWPLILSFSLCSVRKY